MNLYIKLEEGVPVGYPYMEDNLKAAFEVTEITPEFMAEHGFVQFIRPDVPTGSQVVGESGYEMAPDGTVRPIYELREWTQDEKIDRWIRQPRNMALLQSDWSQMPDAPLTAEKKAEWAAYRQELRDMTATYANIQNPAEIVPPTQPAK